MPTLGGRGPRAALPGMFGLAGLLLLGIGAQWIAWRLRVPSILLLLLLGFAVGPWTGHRFLDPEALLGDSLLPFVSLSVAVVLFEGGLSLRFSELRGAGRAVLQLILLGPPIGFALTTVAGFYILGLDWGLSALLGAIMVVTGPTVLLPILRHVRPAGSLGRVVMWEGIVTDPIGAIVAVIVFQVLVLPGQGREIALSAAGDALLAGGLGGLLAAAAVVLLLRRDLVPDFLHTSVVLALALAAFVGANSFMEESGLLAVTLMGILLANQRWVSVEHIVEFKENLRVLLISLLFLLLAARLPIEEFTKFDLHGLVYLLVLLFVVRPAVVFLSTLTTSLGWKERVFVAWMAPRGVVAAAVTSIFALELAHEGRVGADRLVPTVFFVILGTVTVYGLTSLPLARWLGLSRTSPQGVVIVGAHSWARRIGLALKASKIEVLMVDTNFHEVQAARMEGLRAYYGSILSEEFESHAPLDGIGYLMAVTTNDHVNALACLHLAPTLGRANVFQLVPSEDTSAKDRMPRHLRGRVLFKKGASFWTLESRFRDGAMVKRTKLTDDYGFQDFLQQYDHEETPVIPLFVLGESGKLRTVTARDAVQTEAGETLLAVVGPEPDQPLPAEQPAEAGAAT
jgi:NhaP-type Na+/H+ or K+/H+ antiporter